MPKENVELVRRAFAALAEDGVEAALPLYAEDVVVYAVPEWPDQSEYHGHDGIRKLMAQWYAAVDDFKAEVEEVREVGELVVARLTVGGRIAGTASAMSHEYGAVFSDFREGRIGVQRLCSSWTDALRIGGLDP